MKSAFRDWSDVRVFLAVMRAGSTLAASKTLGLSQPTVARRIETLEHALGLTLFNRDTRGFQPTLVGQGLLAEAEALEAAAAAFGDKAGRLTQDAKRVIRITAFQSAFVGRLPVVLDEFISRHPDIGFEFLPNDDPVDIAGGAADVAIRAMQTIDDPTLICSRLYDIRFSVFASKSYVARHGQPASEADFPGHKFAVYDGRHTKNSSGTWLTDRIDPEQIAMTCDRMRGIDGAVLSGAGLGVLPTSFGRDSASIIRCFDLPPEIRVTLWFLASPAAYRRPEVKTFAAFFVPRYRALLQDR